MFHGVGQLQITIMYKQDSGEEIEFVNPKKVIIDQEDDELDSNVFVIKTWPSGFACEAQPF